ncbi:MAG TPA: DUF4351 domain-containing protein [Thermoanaerobaculia bacterium]
MPGGHDQLFKDLIQTFPEDLLHLMTPGVAARIDPASLEFQPAQSFLDLPRGGERRFDLVAKARTRSGEPELILLHVEIELRYRSAAVPRFWTYNRVLSLRHGLPVHTFVLYLRGGPPGAGMSTYREVSLDREICRFRYRRFGLSRAPAEAYIRRRQPLAWAFAALMRSSDRSRQRTACLRRIATARGLSPARRVLLFNCVATYLELDGKASEEFQQLLAELGSKEDQAIMMTWAERFEAEIMEKGRQAGRQEGLREGMERILLRQLKQRFRTLPPDVAQRVSRISSTDELARLAERVLTAGSLEELGLA